MKSTARSINATYVNFSADGRHLLANLGGEQIYLYDTHSHRSPLNYNPDDNSLEPTVGASTDEGDSSSSPLRPAGDKTGA